MKRRAFLRQGIASSALLFQLRVNGVEAESSTPIPLKNIVQGKGLYVGAQATKGQLSREDLGEFVANNFNMLTAGLELKWAALRPTPATFDFGGADWMVDFAAKKSMRFHGHNLCWNVSNPKWFSTVLNPSNSRRMLEEHITTVAKRYSGRVDAWDVVNEPIDLRSPRPDGLHTGPWLDMLGPEYIDIAFHAAAAADPGAIRVLNIYQVEQDQDRSDFVRRATIDHLKEWLKRGVPIQAIGLQSHIGTSLPLASESRDQFVRKVRDMGLEVMITELDVNDSHLVDTASANDRDKIVAGYYYDYLTDVVPLGKTKRITFWTVTDKFNWIDAGSSQGPGRHRPGLLDTDMRPKPVYDAVAKALEHLVST